MNDEKLTPQQIEVIVMNGEELMHIKAFLPEAAQKPFHDFLKKTVSDYINSGALPNVADTRRVFDEAIHALPQTFADPQDSAKARLKKIRDDVESAKSPSPNGGQRRNGGGRGNAA